MTTTIRTATAYADTGALTKGKTVSYYFILHVVNNSDRLNMSVTEIHVTLFLNSLIRSLK